MTNQFSFKFYVKNYKNMEIYNFNEYFKERLENLPDKTISSKKIYELLNISDDYERLLFRRVFLKYFKEKMFNDRI